MLKEQISRLLCSPSGATIHVPPDTISVSDFGHVSIRAGAGPNASLQDRVGSLESNMKALQAEAEILQNEMSAKFRKISESLEKRARALEEASEKISKKLEESATGGIHLSIIGTSWLFLGVLLSTAPVEIGQFVLRFLK